jgi:hypothetical protein
MSHEFTMTVGGVPAGTYPLAEFIGSEDFENNFGKAVKLKWRILGGECDGLEASRICSPNLTAKSALGKLAVCLKGGPIGIGERFRLADYVGCRGSLAVEATESGGGRVSVFLRQAGPQAAPPSPPRAFVAPEPQQASPPPMTADDLARYQQWQASQQSTSERI